MDIKKELDTDDFQYKTGWLQNVNRVNKIGYADGASDGQDAAFQTSFDLGYQQGIGLGMQLGFKKALESIRQNEMNPRDHNVINCQICLNGTSSPQNIGNLYNIQQEKNMELLNKFNQDKVS